MIERKNTLPILSNVLIEAKDNKLNIVATDLDLIFQDNINDLKIDKEGSTTTSATVLYDLLRKLPSNLDVAFNLKTENRLDITAENSNFNLLCLPVDNFPSFTENFNKEHINLDSSKFLSLLNKTKISMSNDETRHYLNGIYIHPTVSNKSSYLTGVATDSHRLSSSSIPVDVTNRFRGSLRLSNTSLTAEQAQSTYSFIYSNGNVRVSWQIENNIQGGASGTADRVGTLTQGPIDNGDLYFWNVLFDSDVEIGDGSGTNPTASVSMVGQGQAGAIEQGLLLAKNNAAGISSTFVTDNLHYNNNTEVLYSKNTKTQILEVQKFQEWNGTDVGTSNQVIMADGSGGWSWQTLTSTNASDLKDSDNPAIKRLVGAEGELGAAFGLDNEWSLRIIEQVGNYGESYKKHIADTGILPNRGPNQLWTKGGILYVPPAR